MWRMRGIAVLGAATIAAGTAIPPVSDYAQATIDRQGQITHIDSPSLPTLRPSAAGGSPKSPNKVILVPVYVHFVTNKDEGRWPRRNAEKLIAALNQGFSTGLPVPKDAGPLLGPKFGTSAPAPFRFQLKGVDYTESKQWYADKHFSASDPYGHSLVEKLHKGDLRTLNIISPMNPAMSDAGGWGVDPEAARAFPDTDGVQLSALSFAYPDLFGASTINHETGHWLGLKHTFDENCDGGGDLVADTPAHHPDVYPSADNRTPDSCPKQPGKDPIWNFMSYGPNARVFTAGQVKRMTEQWNKFRS